MLEPEDVDNAFIADCLTDCFGTLSSTRTCLMAVTGALLTGGIDEDDEDVEIDGDDGKLSSRD